MYTRLTENIVKYFRRIGHILIVETSFLFIAVSIRTLYKIYVLIQL
jgi:hypothetical protein